ncbi:hypothetical protein EDC04DRAFT_1241025 [Pisolithus marmoratus]|nr:hypothetical protein EDC04DRAFT_1241025 [Pisolithus marmoratus]
MPKVVRMVEARSVCMCPGTLLLGIWICFYPLYLKSRRMTHRNGYSPTHIERSVVTHCSHGQLEPVADQPRMPLFNNSTSNAEEFMRTVAAACLGKRTTMKPGRYLPQLHAHARDENAAILATVT